jgi:hypothetical protein
VEATVLRNRAQATGTNVAKGTRFGWAIGKLAKYLHRTGKIFNLGVHARGIYSRRKPGHRLCAPFPLRIPQHGVCMKLLFAVCLFLLPAFAQSQSTSERDAPSRPLLKAKIGSMADYQSPTTTDRLKWFTVTTAGPLSLLAVGPISSAWGTLLDKPKEYGTHWEGFGQRYGMRLTGLSTGNAMEASLGALWGEDPRYFPSPQRGFGPRTKYVIRSAFVAPHRDGQWHPAYARFVGNVGGNFLSNTWRAPSENGTGSALMRVVWGVLGDMAGNAYAEFWPDVRRKVFRK